MYNAFVSNNYAVQHEIDQCVLRVKRSSRKYGIIRYQSYHFTERAYPFSR